MQQQTLAVEEVTQAADQLNVLASTLNAEIEKFKI